MQRKIRLTPVRLLALGYLCVIIIGTILLILPFSSKITGSAAFMDALFTTVSASCVTGLIVQDTATHWTIYGQIVILLLIQIGGIGFMTVIYTIWKLGGKKIGIKERAFMQESVSAPTIAGMGKLTSTILLGTLIFEALGAFVLCFRFVPDYGWGDGIWMAVFTAVSAFCLFGRPDRLPDHPPPDHHRRARIFRLAGHQAQPLPFPQIRTAHQTRTHHDGAPRHHPHAADHSGGK